jgi:hypothetical protein
MPYFSRATWFSLPPRVRQRWWEDTDYGNRPPSKAMAESLASYGLVILGPYRDDEETRNE